jgi:hypothetical protein
MIFLKRKMAIFMVKIRSKVCCHFGRMSQGDIVGRVSAQCPVPLYAPILYRHAPQQTEKIRREIQNPQIVQQTISLNAKRSTLVYGSILQPSSNNSAALVG